MFASSLVRLSSIKIPEQLWTISSLMSKTTSSPVCGLPPALEKIGVLSTTYLNPRPLHRRPVPRPAPRPAPRPGPHPRGFRCLRPPHPPRCLHHCPSFATVAPPSAAVAPPSATVAPPSATVAPPSASPSAGLSILSLHGGALPQLHQRIGKTVPQALSPITTPFIPIPVPVFNQRNPTYVAAPAPVSTRPSPRPYQPTALPCQWTPTFRVMMDLEPIKWSLPFVSLCVILNSKVYGTHTYKSPPY